MSLNPSYDFSILLEPNYKDIIKENITKINNEYAILRLNYNKYKTLDINKINSELMAEIIRTYIFYNTYKIIKYYYNNGLNDFYEFKDDFKFKEYLNNPIYSEAHRLYILYLDSIEVLFQLILAHNIVNEIYKNDKELITKVKSDYDPKQMLHSMHVGIRYKKLIKDYCPKNPIKI